LTLKAPARNKKTGKGKGLGKGFQQLRERVL